MRVCREEGCLYVDVCREEFGTSISRGGLTGQRDEGYYTILGEGPSGMSEWTFGGQKSKEKKGAGAAGAAGIFETLQRLHIAPTLSLHVPLCMKISCVFSSEHICRPHMSLAFNS